MATKALNYTAAEIDARLNLAGTAVQPDALNNYYTKAEVDNIIYENSSETEYVDIDGFTTTEYTGYLSKQTGEVDPQYTDYHCLVSNNVLCSKGDKFAYKGSGRANALSYIIYDGNNRLLSYGQINSTSEYTELEVTDNDAHHIIFSSFNGANSTIVLSVKKVITVDVPISRITRAENNIAKLNLTNITGIKIVNFGDSIAFGENSYKDTSDASSKGYSYAPMLADVLGGTCYNKAVSGYTISQILGVIENNLSIDADIVFLEGGTNDMSATPVIDLGAVAMDNQTTPPSSPATYAEYVERVMYVAKSNWTDAHIFWVLPHRMTTRSYELQENFWGVVKKAAAKWGVKVIDIYSDSCFTAAPLSLGNDYTDANDSYSSTHGGTHPNTEGYKKYYLPVVYDIVLANMRKIL